MHPGNYDRAAVTTAGPLPDNPAKGSSAGFPMSLTFEAALRSFVPQGQSKIAQPFKAGCRVDVVISPVRDDRTGRFSVVPDGTLGTQANAGPSLERLGYFQPPLRDEAASVSDIGLENLRYSAKG